MSEPRLTEASCIVLGLLDLNEPATPYDLKQFAKGSVFPHLADAPLPDIERVRAVG